MNVFKSTLSALAIGATALVGTPLATTSAMADGYGNKYRGGPEAVRCGHWNNYCRGRNGIYKRGHKDNNGHVAGGILLGIIGTAIIADALSKNNQPVYRAPQPQPVDPGYYPPAPSRVAAHSLEPWSQGWHRWCDDRYRSFNAKTGTFRGYDGKDHFCVPK